jgi:hypothetical protein
VWSNAGGRGKGQFLTDPLRDRSENMAEYIQVQRESESMYRYTHTHTHTMARTI